MTIPLRIPHKLISKRPPLVEHPANCGCDFLRSVKHATWVTYDLVDGILACDHCKTRIELPTPCIKENVWSKTVFMDHEAIFGDLERFKHKHQDCPVLPTV